MEIVLANINDSAEILDLRKLSFRQEAEIYNDFTIPPLMQTIEEINKAFDDNTIMKAVIDNKIIASVGAYVKNGRCYIGKLIVHPDPQNKGIGTKLMNEIERYFENQGINVFELFTGEKSHKNIYLYKKLGYQIFKTEGHKNGANIVYLKKEIRRQGT